MAWRHAYKHVTVDLDSVNIYPGQYIVLWMNRHRESEAREAIQVDLRVTESGAVEIFTHIDQVKFVDYEQWKDEPLP